MAIVTTKELTDIDGIGRAIANVIEKMTKAFRLLSTLVDCSAIHFSANSCQARHWGPNVFNIHAKVRSVDARHIFLHYYLPLFPT